MSPAKETSEFPYKIQCAPDFALLTITLPPGNAIQVEASSLVAMDASLEMKSSIKGSLTRLLTGESLFINEFSSDKGKGEISIAPGAPGDIVHVHLKNDTLYLQNSAFLASGMGVNLETKWQGLIKGFFSSEGLFLIRCSGHGSLWFNTYGAVIQIDIDENFIVDTGHVVAFTKGLEYTLAPVSGYKSLFFSGEGLACHFRGQGRLWIQTRQVPSLSNWMRSFRPVKTSRSSSDGE